MKAANNDKNKVIVLAALGVVLLGVGAFSITGGGAPATAPATEAAEEKSSGPAEGVAETDEQRSPFVNAQLPQRDPFSPQISKRSPEAAVADNTPPPAPAPARTAPLAPMSPMRGDIAGLPNPTAEPSEPDQFAGRPAPSEPIGPSFRLTGVVLSEQPMAIILVNGGRQRAVRVGDQLSGYRVASISRRSVVLESNGQRTTLAFNGNADNE